MYENSIPVILEISISDTGQIVSREEISDIMLVAGRLAHFFKIGIIPAIELMDSKNKEIYSYGSLYSISIKEIK